MITLEQQIQELRAELLGCRLTPRERREIEVELTQVIIEFSTQELKLDREFDAFCRQF